MQESCNAGDVPLLKNCLRCFVRTVPGNMHVKFEVHSFNHFEAICGDNEMMSLSP